MKGKKVLALVMCAVMAAGITVPVMAEEKDDSGREVIKAEQKKAFSVLTDGTNEYTDSNGNIYINN